MSIISIQSNDSIETFLSSQMKKGFKSKSDVIRQAIWNYMQETEVLEILQASQEIKDGKGLKGDLRKLAKKFK